MLRDVVLTATGLSVGIGALLVVIYFRASPRRVWHAMAWLGVTGTMYIIGRYVVYPQSEIPYTGLVAWFTAFLSLIFVGGTGIVVSRKRL